MEFNAEERATINTLRIKNWIICELEASLILFYTGISRESAYIIADQSNNMVSGDIDSVEAMHALKREAVRMKECILKGDRFLFSQPSRIDSTTPAKLCLDRAMEKAGD
jgi:D-glycero-alpha-D-manno-heptose-7-phosphate kinase